MRTNLQTLIRRIGNKIEEEKVIAVKEFKRIIDRIYDGAVSNPTYAGKFSTLVETLKRSAVSGVLERRIDGVISYLNRGLTAPQESADEEKITLPEAVEAMRQEDKKNKIEPLSDGGYRARIYRAEKMGKLAIERESPRKAYVSRRDIIKVAGEYEEPTEEVTAKIGDRKVTGTQSEVYNSLRRSGMKHSEIMERHPHLCPPGKDIKKFFSGLEGAYKKYGGAK